MINSVRYLCDTNTRSSILFGILIESIIRYHARTFGIIIMSFQTIKGYWFEAILKCISSLNPMAGGGGILCFITQYNYYINDKVVCNCSVVKCINSWKIELLEKNQQCENAIFNLLAFQRSSVIFSLTSTSHERHGVANHRELEWFRQIKYQTLSVSELNDSMPAENSISGDFAKSDRSSSMMTSVRRKAIFSSRSKYEEIFLFCSHHRVCWWNSTDTSWWRHEMDTFSASLAICVGNSPVPGEFPSQRPVTQSFDVFFDLRLNKRLSKQSRGWWFETQVRPSWRHCNVLCPLQSPPGSSCDLDGRW